jgi:hypothetical protein
LEESKSKEFNDMQQKLQKRIEELLETLRKERENLQGNA